MPTQLVIDIREQLGFETVVTGYGLTETHGVSTMCRHDDAPEVIAKTVGRPLPGVEVRVVDETGNALATGEQGEVVIRGFNLMKGYYDDPDATAEAIDADGWLHTGDVAYQDDGGNLVITDRLKDMFIVGGFNAYPAEIENIMSGHAAVASVAVVGVPDARLGEVGMAFVVPTTGTELDTDAADRVVPREHGELQGAALRRDRRRAPAQRVEQGVEVRARGTRPPTSERRMMFTSVHSSVHDSASLQNESVRSGVR